MGEVQSTVFKEELVLSHRGGVKAFPAWDPKNR